MFSCYRIRPRHSRLLGKFFPAVRTLFSEVTFDRSSRPFASEILAGLSETSAGPRGERISSQSLMTECQREAAEVLLAPEVDTDKPLVPPTDLILTAETGSGKTLAYLTPLASRLARYITKDSPEGVYLMVLVPTRELVQQISRSLVCKVTTSLLSHHPVLRSSFLCGGYSIEDDVKRIAQEDRPHVLVCTPGRLISHLSTTSGLYGLLKRSLDLLVIDEFDRMADMGFLPQLEHIYSTLLGSRSDVGIVLCSATISPVLDGVAKRILRHGFRRTGTPSASSATPDKLRQEVLFFNADKFQETLEAVIYRATVGCDTATEWTGRRVLVLFPTVRILQLFYVMTKARRRQKGTKAALHATRIAALHAQLSNDKRRSIADEFLYPDNTCLHHKVLFATDVAARGLDWSRISHVIQVDVPHAQTEGEVVDQYVHRIGRTARGGSEGASTLLIPRQLHLNGLPRILADHSLEVLDEAEVLETYLSKLPVEEMESAWIEPGSCQLGYRSLMAFYHRQLQLSCTHDFDVRKGDIVKCVNQMVFSTGLLKRQPMLNRKFVDQLGFTGLPGIRIGSYYEKAREAEALQNDEHVEPHMHENVNATASSQN
ncbi:hypothetical protein FOZ62_026210 [Perkinsus olseni]|uniref:ATP-dependent RNA helicase n=2 Tax=Perkinsus olseni TaxID=32597 RepID=A0A7J6QS03_PEROL|nr:hypothetical protein FOZ62_026210 [Perkinsus olseni]